ncbi:hypothetical protein [Nafulsella turpanensis]|uniref:hypothetical protein n=1 Tax=Nafulsella turpanensis TaxID=1265690 RepID=UPI00034799C6|nr:hypothetical protein [Nafulsella turpanensis]
MMKKTILLFLLTFLAGTAVQAQFIKNKLNLHLSYAQLIPEQEDHVREGEYYTPSLFNNMNTRLSFSVKASYKVLPYLSLGIGTDRSHYKNWTYNDYTHYSHAKITETAFYPLLELHTEQTTRGFFNRIRPRLQFSPVIGRAKVSFAHPHFFVKSMLPISPGEILSATNTFRGIKASVGLDVVIHQNAGFSAAFGIKDYSLSPQLYPDTELKQTFLEAGIFYRFVKNKRFYL